MRRYFLKFNGLVVFITRWEIFCLDDFEARLRHGRCSVWTLNNGADGARIVTTVRVLPCIVLFEYHLYQLGLADEFRPWRSHSKLLLLLFSKWADLTYAIDLCIFLGVTLSQRWRLITQQRLLDLCTILEVPRVEFVAIELPWVKRDFAPAHRFINWNPLVTHLPALSHWTFSLLRFNHKTVPKDDVLKLWLPSRWVTRAVRGGANRVRARNIPSFCSLYVQRRLMQSVLWRSWLAFLVYVHVFLGLFVEKLVILSCCLIGSWIHMGQGRRCIRLGYFLTHVQARLFRENYCTTIVTSVSLFQRQVHDGDGTFVLMLILWGILLTLAQYPINRDGRWR